MTVIASGCTACNPLLTPSPALQGNGHVAAHLEHGWKCSILINGERVTDVAEAWPGKPGKVKRYHPSRNSPLWCLCGSGIMFAQIVTYDSVEVVVPDD